VLSYRVTLDVPLHLVVFLSGLLAVRRGEIGTRRGTRALTCFRQAVFTLAWFRDRPGIRRLGAGFGISQATAYRYVDEALERGFALMSQRWRPCSGWCSAPARSATSPKLPWSSSNSSTK
jgi:hypothetical protein